MILWIFLKNQDNTYGRSSHLRRPVLGIRRIKAFSAFAGQPLLISPAHLKELGLLEEAELSDCPRGDGHHVDYGTIIPWKFKILASAFSRFLHTSDKMLLEEYDAFFYNTNQFWLDDYALFMACKAMHDGKDWLSWEEAYCRPTDSLKKELKKQLSNEIQYHYFVQFLFFKEWYALEKNMQTKRIYRSSATSQFLSLWTAPMPGQINICSNWIQKVIRLQSPVSRRIIFRQPDSFGAISLYNWDAHKKEGYKWWISRIRNQLDLLDYLRIDHFRGFEAYWAVPFGEETAINGTWKHGPKEDLFLAIEKALGKNLPIIAEDLGVITPEVEKLRDQFHFPGMKVLQFAFESTEEGDISSSSVHYNKLCVLYRDTRQRHQRRLVSDCKRIFQRQSPPLYEHGRKQYPF